MTIACRYDHPLPRAGFREVLATRSRPWSYRFSLPEDPCIRVIAVDAAGRPFCLPRRDSNGGPVEMHRRYWIQVEHRGGYYVVVSAWPMSPHPYR